MINNLIYILKNNKVNLYLNTLLTKFRNYIYFFVKKVSINRLKRISYFFRKYVYTINHKRIALNYFYFSLLSSISGAFLALMIRLELSHPGSTFFRGNSLFYLQVVTSHGLIMVFFVVVPIIFGFFGNFLIPLHIGSKDVAYPRLNSIGFWLLPIGFILICKSAFLKHKMWKKKQIKEEYYLDLFSKNKDIGLVDNNKLQLVKKKRILDIEEEDILFLLKNLRHNLRYYIENLWTYKLKPSYDVRQKIISEKSLSTNNTCAGWTFITPLSSNTIRTAEGPMDYLIIAVLLAGVSTTIGFINLLVTRRTLSMPGLHNRRFLIPFVSISILLTLRFLALITPVLASCMIMIFTDRHWKTSFFDFSYGGDPILSQHLFWFFGHPEVYVLIIPTFGIINMVLPYSSLRRVSSKQHMIWAIYVMGYMGFLVWGHHMYLVGLDHKSRTLYSTVTVMISLPATIKIISWTLTVLNSPIKASPLTIGSFIYILFFLVSGLTGMWLSHIIMNISMHDTYYVVAHFHFMLSATAMLGLMIGVYYYFNTFFNIRLSTTFIWLHLINFTLGHLLTFIPQFFLGVAGMPRRVNDYPDIFSGWQGLSTAGYFITLIGVVGFLITLLDSHIKSKIDKNHLLVPRVNNRATFFSTRVLKQNSNFYKGFKETEEQLLKWKKK